VSIRKPCKQFLMGNCPVTKRGLPCYKNCDPKKSPFTNEETGRYDEMIAVHYLTHWRDLGAWMLLSVTYGVGAIARWQPPKVTPVEVPEALT